MIKTVVIAFYKENRLNSDIVKTVSIDINPIINEEDFNKLSCEEVIKLTKTDDLFQSYPYVSWGYVCA